MYVYVCAGDPVLVIYVCVCVYMYVYVCAGDHVLVIYVCVCVCR